MESDKSVVQTNKPHWQMHANLQKRIPLIINYLSIKTHETTGNKPAKPEMKNKCNMTPNHSTPTTYTQIV
jgi:hypothetical protein